MIKIRLECLYDLHLIRKLESDRHWNSGLATLSQLSSLISLHRLLGMQTHGDVDDSNVVDGGGVKITINVPEEIIEELLHFRRKLLY